MNQKIAMNRAREIWINCIHKNITGFTLTQEKRAIKLIAELLVRWEQDETK